MRSAVTGRRNVPGRRHHQPGCSHGCLSKGWTSRAGSLPCECVGYLHPCAEQHGDRQSIQQGNLWSFTSRPGGGKWGWSPPGTAGASFSRYKGHLSSSTCPSFGSSGSLKSLSPCRPAYSCPKLCLPQHAKSAWLLMLALTARIVASGVRGPHPLWSSQAAK